MAVFPAPAWSLAVVDVRPMNDDVVFFATVRVHTRTTTRECGFEDVLDGRDVGFH